MNERIKVTNIFNQNDPIGTRWVYTRACPFEIYERREGMFKFIGYERHDEVTGKPRWMIRKPHKKDFEIFNGRSYGNAR